MLSNFRSSNPAFSPFFWKKRVSKGKMSVLGIFIKSCFCILLLTFSTSLVWFLFYKGQSIGWYTSGGMITAIVISIIISLKHNWAHILVPLYAIAKGLFLGGFSVHIHKQYPDLPFLAVGITILCFVIMIFLYKTKIIVLTKRLRSTIVIASTTICAIYLISWILSFFGVNTSIIWGTGWFAFAFNLFAAVTASFALLIDIDYIDKQRNKAPKYNEWIATWGLLVTLIWLYVEVLRFMRRLAIK